MEKEPRPQEFSKQNIIKELHRLKTDYQSGVPDEIKHSVSKDSGWKVQRGVWFQNVEFALSDVLEKSLGGEISISKGLFDEISTYHRKLTSDDNSLKHRLTTQEDIDEAESLVDKISAELER